MTVKDLLAMKLHESKWINDDVRVIRVADGWIYEIISPDESNSCCAFVPSELDRRKYKIMMEE